MASGLGVCSQLYKCPACWGLRGPMALQGYRLRRCTHISQLMTPHHGVNCMIQRSRFQEQRTTPSLPQEGSCLPGWRSMQWGAGRRGGGAGVPGCSPWTPLASLPAPARRLWGRRLQAKQPCSKAMQCLVLHTVSVKKSSFTKDSKEAWGGRGCRQSSPAETVQFV